MQSQEATAAQLTALALGNYGHFTTMLVTDGRVRGLDLHLRRLVDDSRLLFDHDLDPDQIRVLVRRHAPTVPAAVRVTVFAPDLPLDRPSAPVRPVVAVTTRPAPAGVPSALRLVSVPYRRDLPSVKHVGLFGPVLHRRAAQRTGADDAVFVDARSRLSEGPTWNIGFVDADGTVVWPAADCLAGVTMRLLDRACRAAGPATARRHVDLTDTRRMRAAFVTNAAVGVRPVAALDTTCYDPEYPVLHELARRYLAVPDDTL